VDVGSLSMLSMSLMVNLGSLSFRKRKMSKKGMRPLSKKMATVSVSLIFGNKKVALTAIMK
jgi:hypothetical protein